MATLALYWKTGSFDFINYDDQDYVYANNHITSGLSRDNFFWSLTATDMGNWIPVTWLSHMLDSTIFGLAPKGHHLTSIFFHTANTLLLCYALTLATGRFLSSAFIAALFSLHPLHVESVAWVAERKDVLSAFFCFLTIIAYIKYTHQPGVKRYVLIIVLYSLGLLAKPMIVTLPIILLLLDNWPLQRLSLTGSDFDTNKRKLLATLFLEKVPLLLLSATVSSITILIQKDHGALLQLERLSITTRIINAFVSYTTYLLKFFYPTDLAIFYPLVTSHPPAKVLISIALVTIMLLFAILTRKRFPFLLVGWLWFLIMLLPVIGVLQVGLQSRADRYTYIPLIGILIVIIYGTENMLNVWQWKYKKQLTMLIAAIILCCMGYLTSGQLNYWKDGVTLYTHTLNVTGNNNFTVQYNLAATLANKGKTDEAIYHYQQALKSAPLFFEEAYISLGLEFEYQRRYQEAMYYFAEVLRNNPDNFEAKKHMQSIMLKIRAIQ